MGRKASRLSLRSVSLLALGFSAFAIPLSSWAEGRPVTFSFQQGDGYGRIIASWEDGDETAPQIAATMTGPVMVLRFEEPVEFDPEEFQDGLPDYIAVARLADDGREARVALAREYRLHQSYSYDLAGIDLVPAADTSDPADVVSPLAAIKRQEAARAEQAAEAARLASIPSPLPVRLAASETEDFSTLAFYWPQEIPFSVEENGRELTLTFDRRAEADLAPTRVDPPTGLRSINAENTETKWIVNLDMMEGYWASAVEVDNTAVVRFRPGQKPEDEAEAVVLPAALQALADQLPDDGIEPPSRKPFDTAPDVLTPDPDTFAAADASAGPAYEYNFEDVAAEPEELPPITPPRLWNEALNGGQNVVVEGRPKSRGVDLDFAFRSEIPATIFRRHGAVWIAFPANGKFELSRSLADTGFRIDQVQSEEGMSLRVFAPSDLMVNVTSSGRLWSVSIGGEGDLASTSLQPTRSASSGGSGIIVDVPNAGTVFTMTDPEVGETLELVSAMEHTTSLPKPLNFVEASFPVTTQGLVIVPRADDLSILQRGDQILISLDKGMALSNWGVQSELVDGQSLSPGFLDFESWRRGDMGSFWSNYGALSRAAAIADMQEWSGQSANIDLARFLLAWELAPETFGPLRIAAEADPILEQDAQWLALKGGAEVMLGRYEEALETLDKSAVRTDPAVAAWRGYAEAELGDWRKARQSFLEANPLIDAYFPLWAGRFHAAAARANIRMGDGSAAERHAEAARRTGDPVAMGQASLTLGELALAAGRKNDAQTIFSKLLDHEDPNVRVRAELSDTMLGLETGRISLMDAADRLDSLRFRWRGDALELEIVAALSDVQFRLGNFREALQLAQSFAMQFPDMPGARELRIQMSEYFDDLFLNSKADDIDPIQALALFYEFRDLTPIGPDGDRMIRKLANRLVAFDLLDPATELLAHQVENRNLIGASRAKIAADLASIYLIDKRPEEALRVIGSTRQTGLDDDLRLERRLLEAAAHMELQRYSHAIELLESLSDQRSKELLAEVHWRARSWGPAGRALQNALPDPGVSSLTPSQVQTAIRAAVAYRLDGNPEGLADLRAGYTPAMSQTAQSETFDLLTGSTRVTSTRLTDIVKSLADTSSANAFISGLKQKFGGAGGQR